MKSPAKSKAAKRNWQNPEYRNKLAQIQLNNGWRNYAVRYKQ